MTSVDVDRYLADVPQPQRSTLQVVRGRIREQLPEAEEYIHYGVPAFKVAGRAVAGFAQAKKHCSYFPMSGAVLSEISDRLTAYDWSRGTLRFGIDDPLPPDLISLLVRTRLAQIERG